MSGSQTQRYPEPARPTGLRCGHHPSAGLEWEFEEGAWLCPNCGLDAEDTFTHLLDYRHERGQASA